MSSEFENACAFVRANSAELDKAELLYFYARYKVVTVGQCNVDKPAFYQLTEKSKWQAWTDLADMSPDVATSQYIERLDCLNPEWRGQESKDPTSGWVSVSCPQQEEALPDEQKTVWDWVKENNLDKLKALVTVDNIGDEDEDGMTLIHWASDRGHVNTIRLLFDIDSSVINVQDGEGQTALHYAASCGHGEVVKFLLEMGADADIADADGYLPNNSDTNADIKEIFDSFKKI